MSLSRKRPNEDVVYTEDARNWCNELGIEPWKSLVELGRTLNIPDEYFVNKKSLCGQLEVFLGSQEPFRVAIDELEDQHWLDPVSLEPLTDPYLANDGYNYNLGTLEALFDTNPEPASPLNPSVTLKQPSYPNWVLRRQVREWLNIRGVPLSEEEVIKPRSRVQMPEVANSIPWNNRTNNANTDTKIDSNVNLSRNVNNNNSNNAIYSSNPRYGRQFAIPFPQVQFQPYAFNRSDSRKRQGALARSGIRHRLTYAQQSALQDFDFVQRYPQPPSSLIQRMHEEGLDPEFSVERQMALFARRHNLQP
jgi:hypothetical protein